MATSDYHQTTVYVSYVLYLNSVYDRYENTTAIKRFPSIEAARTFYDRERVAWYRDSHTRHFREGGPLYNYNRPGEEWWTGLDEDGRGLQEVFSRAIPS